MTAFESFLRFLETYWFGIAVLIIIMFLIFQGIRFLARTFCWGRYKESTHDKKDGAMFLIGDFFSKIINDFRHLLAIIIVLIFFAVLIYCITLSETHEDRLDSIQKIFASLGMLLSSIIGFYFGEAKGEKSVANNITMEETQGTSNVDEEMEVPEQPEGLD